MRKRLLLLAGTALVALSVTIGAFALAPRVAHAATVRNVQINCGGQLPPVCYTTIHDAVNAAVAGDTVLVHPGVFTETSTLAITVPLRLEGFGPGKTILRGSLDPDAISISLAAPGTLTIAGFTLEGNHQPHPGSSDLIEIMDAQATNSIEIAHNAFVSTSDTDPNHATQFTEALHNFNSTAARLTIAHNEFSGFSQVSELFNYVGPVQVVANLVHRLDGFTVFSHVGFDEFTCCDPLVIPNAHTYLNNTFAAYTGAGILIESNNARFDDMRIQGNTFTLTGPSAIGAISIGGFGTVGRVQLNARDNTIQLTGAMDGIEINQNVTGTLARNALTGNSVVGSNGIAVSIGSAQPTALGIASNRVTLFDTGLAVANAAPPGGSAAQTVAANKNCIFSNASFGANNTTALTIDATADWWGAASGPFNAASNPGGAGNAVSSGIAFIPFLPAPAPTCP